jgi:hypothetical protein
MPRSAVASASGGLVTAYAKAAARVQAPGVSGRPWDVEADARAFLDWVSTTKSHHPPPRPRPVGAGRRIVDVDVFEEAEATAYLTQQLTHAGKAHLLDGTAGNLAEALGHLPLALSHATAYMIAQRVTCGSYLDRYTAGAERLDQLMPEDPDGHAPGPSPSPPLLALDAADAQEPIGLARPAIELAAVLDPAGHLEALWATDAVSTHLTTYCTTGGSTGPITATQARAASLLLDRYGLAWPHSMSEPVTEPYASTPSPLVPHEKPAWPTRSLTGCGPP